MSFGANPARAKETRRAGKNQGCVMLAVALAAVLLVLTAPAFAGGFTVAPAPELDALFQNTEGWIGADGDYSVPLGDGRTLWLFSDSFVGRVENCARAGAALVNNSAAIQKGGKVAFYYGTKADGGPDAFVRPRDGRGYYWLFAGVRAAHDLFFFLMRVENTGGGGAFGFRGFGANLARVKNPDETPDRWRIEQLEFPFCDYGQGHNISFGRAIHKEGRCIYMYGLDSRKLPASQAPGMVVARVDEDKFVRFDAWQFYNGHGWSEDFRASARVCPGIPSEFSVTWQPLLKKYVAVYTEGGIFGVICMRTAPSPTGPWSEPVRLFECPDRLWHKDAFSYAAKAHPSLAADDELVISYATNSGNFGDLIADARLYWPRFIRVTFNATAAHGR